MRTLKEINKKKKNIIDQITDLKVNLNAISIVNNKLKEEKRYFKYDFSKRTIQDKREEILKILKKEDELASWASLKEKRANVEHPAYSRDFYQDEINDLIAKPVLIKSTGILKISGADKKGEIHYLKGEIIYTIFNNVKGERGFFDIVRLNAGIAHFFVKEKIDTVPNIDKGIFNLIKGTVLS